jgi:Zn-dependent M28 family amino/carboxypeptidase
MMINTIKGVIVLLFITIVNNINAQPVADVANLKTHIYYLASDKLNGRAPGTKGEKLAQKYIIAEFKKDGLIPKGEKGYLQHFTYHLPKNPHDTIVDANKQYNGSNVIGYIDNGQPYTIVIGAHYDHLGDDGRGNSLDPNPKGKIHHGADDNASGVAGVLELARYFATNNIKEQYNFLFMCFSAEEAGLIGSKYFTNHPTIPLETINCMINMDMVGRLNDSTKKVIIYGTGTSNVWEPLIKNMKSDLSLKLDLAGVGPSDQTSFYLKDIPVLFFFTGQHSDYHKPSDIASKINYTGEQDVLGLVAQVVDSIQNYPKMNFQKTANKESRNNTFKVTLGIMPDYAFDKEGVRIDGVSDNKPAYKAGLKASDVIIQLGDYPVKDIYGYMDALNKFNKGDHTKVIVNREGEKKEFSVTF